METTDHDYARMEVDLEEGDRLIGELASLSAHVNAATARWIQLISDLREADAVSDFRAFLAYRLGITPREVHEVVRVAEALQELPLTRAAFARGELTLTKVRALTRVATASTEEGLLGLARVLTASQLQRAIRAFQRVTTAEAERTHELEFVSYYFEEDGSLFLRARLPAEDGTLVVKALDAARERVLERRRQEREAAAGGEVGGDITPDEPRALGVESLLELASVSLAVSDDETPVVETRIVVHIDAAALSGDGPGCSELDDGPVIAPETARRLGCDAELVAQICQDGIPLTVGRKRRTVPPALRRVLEARDDATCCFPGCDRRRHLQAHHRQHWAHGGETSLDNLVLLCFQHHRLVHEGGYTIETGTGGGLRFRNRHGLVCETLAPRPPPGSVDELLRQHLEHGLEIGPHTNRQGEGDRMELDYVVGAFQYVTSPDWVPSTEHAATAAQWT